ncbi:hypothetical protein DFH07DRAFT_704973, partial [Mycena maculata]
CPDCQLEFACHWPLVHSEHTQSPCEGGYDGLPQCVLNHELIKDNEWDARMLRLSRIPLGYCVPLRAYRWIPARLPLTGWVSLKNVTWAERFQSQITADFPTAPVSASMRRMSGILSMPMTALYALECLSRN